MSTKISATNKKYEFVTDDTVTTLDGRELTHIRALTAIGAFFVPMSDRKPSQTDPFGETA